MLLCASYDRSVTDRNTRASLTAGLLSDTHIPHRMKQLPDVVFDILDGVDVILHAGDVDRPGALEPLRQIAPVYAVRGNFHVFDLFGGLRFNLFSRLSFFLWNYRRLIRDDRSLRFFPGSSYVNECHNKGDKREDIEFYQITKRCTYVNADSLTVNTEHDWEYRI